MDLKYIISGIFDNENGIHLLHFIDNALVQKKAKEKPYYVDDLFEKYIESLNLKTDYKLPISTSDVIDHINIGYKNLRKEERYIVYMDSIRHFFFSIAHDLEIEKTNHKTIVNKTKKLSETVDIVPLSRERIRRKCDDSHTVISESTNIKSNFTKYSAT